MNDYVFAIVFIIGLMIILFIAFKVHEYAEGLTTKVIAFMDKWFK